MLKKFTSGLLSAVMLAASTAFSMPAPSVTAASEQNYADALDKSLFFYEAQQAGPLPSWNRVEWKTDSTMSDGVLGGWYDAGDHVKFNLPMAYSASMLAWGMYQYPDGLEKTGLAKTYQNNLEFVLDYLADCDKGTEAVFQVGNGTMDHTWWGPIGLIEYGMEDGGASYEAARATLKASKGCSAVFGEMAAALAAGAAALDGKIDASKKASYIDHAENLFKMADASKSDDVYNDSDASGFYRSSHFYDELFYAANWLYIATKDSSYLDKAKGYIPNLSKMLGEGDTLAYGWGHCWDDTMQGAMLLYAINTGEYKDHVKKHLDRWVAGANEPKKTQGGLRWLTTWGCLRYANTAGFLAEVASDTIFKGENTSDYETFAEEQINYSLGDNPRKSSYVVGYGSNYPKNPHHRTAHGSWKNDLAVPATNRHILYGALVGGPNEDGSYEDDRGNYINNEVATDYNAGFTALLCKMVDKYGGEKDPNFPPKEEHDSPEFYVECTSKGADASGMTISFKITNHSAWPARVQDNISFRYYMDLSEVKAAGADPENVVVRCDRDQSKMYAGVTPAEISGIKHYDGDIYYVEVTLPDGRAVLPISEGMQQCEILLALVMPDYGSGWDAANDFSNKDILGAKTTTTEDGTVHGIITPYVPVYVNGKLYYGEEPDGTKADGLGGTGDPKPVITEPDVPKVTTTTTAPKVTEPASPAPTESTTVSVPAVTEPTPSSPSGGKAVLYGDANVSGLVDISDAVLIMQSLANPSKYELEGEGKDNADCSNVGDGVTNKDALAVQKYMLQIIDKLPE